MMRNGSAKPRARSASAGWGARRISARRAGSCSLPPQASCTARSSSSTAAPSTSRRSDGRAQMNLEPTPGERAFRDEVREWLREHAPSSLPSAGTREGFEARRAWEQELFRAGYGAIRWPVEYGGGGG